MSTSSNTSSGRPRSFDRDEVLDRAVEVFWQQGYRSTTTRDLESELGLGQSSIYNTFGSKQDLFVAALDRYESRVTDEVLPPLKETDADLEAIVEFFERLADWVTRDDRAGCMLINLMASDGGETDEIAERTRDYRRRVRASLEDVLREAAREGELDEEALETRADLLMGLVLGLNVAARGGGDEDELDGILASVRFQLDSWRET